MAELAARPLAFPGRGLVTRAYLNTGAVVLTLAALALRTYGIDRESLWRDEGYTLLIAHLPLLRLVTVGGAHEHPPLYYAVVHMLLLAHDSYLVPRLVSAAAGSLAVLVLYALGARIFNRATGLIASTFLAVSPFHLWHSQDGRGYELAALLVLLSYFWLFSALDRPHLARWAAYAVCSALALYAEYTVAFVLLPQAAFLIRARRRGLIRSLAGCWAAVSLVYLPWIGTLAANIAKIDAGYWIPAPTPVKVGETVIEMLGLQTTCPTLPTCRPIEAPLPFFAGHEMALALAAALTALAALAWAVRRRDFAVSVLALWLFVPFGVILLISIRRPIFLDRFFLDATFPLYLLLGLAMVKSFARARASAPVFLVVAGLLAGNLASVWETYATPSNPDYRSAASAFLAAYRTGENVLFFPSEDRFLYGAYLPSDFTVGRSESIWLSQYLDLAGSSRQYAASTRRLLRDTRYPLAVRYRLADVWLLNHQLASWVRLRGAVWLLTDAGRPLLYVHRWFLEHGFYLVVNESYGGGTRLELWDR